MSRLSNSIRRQMALALVRHKFGDRVTIGRRQIGGVRGEGGGWNAECESLPFLQGEMQYDAIAYQDGEIADRITAFNDACAALYSDMTDAYAKAAGALAQFMTGKQLAENWPEAMPVIGHLIPEDNRQLPVVQVAKLNAEFDLPPEAIAA